MVRLIVFLLILLPVARAQAAVEIALEGNAPTRIEEVYHRDGKAYLAIDDVLPVLGMTGHWHSVKHVYTISTPVGKVVISPGSHFMRSGEVLTPLVTPPRFIDGRLRISGDFVQNNLAALAARTVAFRNLDPGDTRDPNPGTELDRLFAFLLRREPDDPAEFRTVSRVAIDPGHGGEDPGSIGLEGVKEKRITLEIAQKLEKQIKMKMGLPVVLTRNNDYALTGEQRLKALSQSGADLLLILHAQGSLSPVPRGVVLFVRPKEEQAGGTVSVQDESMRLARALQSSLKAAGLPVAGIVRAPLLPLGRGDLPGVLVEMGYLSRVEDQARLSVEAGQQALALALYDGLHTYAGQNQEEQL